MADCLVCERPVPDVAYACTGCGDKAKRQLDAIIELTGPARDIAHRQRGRGAGVVGGHGSEVPLPLDLGATARVDAVANSLTGWARAIWEDRGGQPNMAGDPLEAAARYIAGQTEWLRHQRFADEALADIGRCARILASIADGPRERRYAGPCDCGADLYARPGSGIARCRTCNTDHDVAARQEWMRGQVEDRLARPIEIAGILLRLGVPVGYSTIAAYAQHGRIVAHGKDKNGKDLYRIGDVLDIRMGIEAPRRVG